MNIFVLAVVLSQLIHMHRLSDDFVLYNLICVAEKYSERLTNSELCRMRLLRLEHIYYKRDFVNITPRGATKLLTSKVVKLLEKGEDPPPEDIQGQTVCNSLFYVVVPIRYHPALLFLSSF